jgi:Ca-activated chloride channel homolog
MLKFLHDEKGNVIILIAALMPVFILLAASSVDVSYMLEARNEMQAAVDASALAAASGLGTSFSTARGRGIAISNSNTIMEQPLALQSSEVTFLNYKTVRISAQRTIPLYFARIAGMNTVTVSATATAQCGNRDIMLVFDRSGSMDDDTSDPAYPQPITGAKGASYYFIDQIEANTLVVDRIGLVSYSDNATLARVLDRQFSAMKATIAGYVANGFTNIGDGILQAMNHLNSSSPARTQKTIILFSDGMANRPGAGNTSDPRAVAYAISQANAAKSSNIKIYTISLGSTTDPNLMRQIASITNGKYYYAPGAADLYDIFEDISRRIPVALIL